MTKITVTTSDCEGCGQGVKEGGLSVLLIGDYGTECQSNGLDNLELRDYAFGNTAVFDGEPELDGDDDGLGHCKDVRENLIKYLSTVYTPYKGGPKSQPQRWISNLDWHWGLDRISNTDNMRPLL